MQGNTPHHREKKKINQFCYNFQPIKNRQMFPKRQGCNHLKKQTMVSTIDEWHLNHLLFSIILTGLGAIPLCKRKGRQNESSIKDVIRAHIRNTAKKKYPNNPLEYCSLESHLHGTKNENTSHWLYILLSLEWEIDVLLKSEIRQVTSLVISSGL